MQLAVLDDVARELELPVGGNHPEVVVVLERRFGVNRGGGIQQPGISIQRERVRAAHHVDGVRAEEARERGVRVASEVLATDRDVRIGLLRERDDAREPQRRSHPRHPRWYPRRAVTCAAALI